MNYYFHQFFQYFIFYGVLIKSFVYGNSQDVKIGGIFDFDQKQNELAFKYVTFLINEQKILYPNRLIPITERIDLNNEFFVSKTVCSMLSKGIFAIFSPSSKQASNYIQSISETKEIPLIENIFNPGISRSSCLVNIYPFPSYLSLVYADLIKSLQWKSFTILYENNESLIRLNQVIKMNNNYNYFINYKELDPKLTGNYRSALLELKKSGQTHFLLDCSINILPEVLKHALQVGLMSDLHHYIITNLDLRTLDLFSYQHGGANITGVQIINTNDEDVKKILDEFNIEQNVDSKMDLRVEVALIYDSVKLFTETLSQLSFSKYIQAKSLQCNDSNSWEHGYSIINFMKTNSIKGLTGTVKFDYQGFRSDFNLQIIELTSKGLRPIGFWNSIQGLQIKREALPDNHVRDESNLQNKSFIVLIALSEPYQMLKKTSHKLSGNNRFEGFGIDLIHELSLMLGFNYTFKLQEDGLYGTKNLITQEWNGMIRELLDFKADLAITDLTITSEREEAVDFTSPFMNLGISILYKKPMKLPPSLFSFMSPFSESVWYYLGGAYVGVSLMLYLLARLSPSEWTNKLPCVEEPEYLENQFTFKNCFWFTLGSLMQQGSELAPIAISTRMVAGTWWFFTLIMVSSYTANLAAFLTVESVASPFKTVEELANQNDIKYGAKKGGATSNFFRDSSYHTYQKISKFLEANPDVMTDSNPEGVRRAENENYAFFMESTTIEYTVERHCNLTKIGKLLDDKGYGIAMRKNSSYRHALSTAILKLQETGKLRSLKTKWWKEKRGGGLCTSEDSGGDKTELDLANLGGVFFVLVVGSVAGLFIGITEMILDVINMSFRNKTPFKQELQEELRFFFRFKTRTKQIRFSRSRATSKQSFEEFDFPQQTYVYAINKDQIH